MKRLINVIAHVQTKRRGSVTDEVHDDIAVQSLFKGSVKHIGRIRWIQIQEEIPWKKCPFVEGCCKVGASAGDSACKDTVATRGVEKQKPGVFLGIMLLWV